jgi:hypothetical protein
MLYALIAIFVMVSLLDKALRRGRVEVLLLEMRFKLFAVRDELREGVINGVIPENKWFEYLDTSITKAIDLLPTITAWEVLGLGWRYKNDPEILQAQVALFEALGKEENEKLAETYGKFLGCIVELLFRRHVAIRYGMTGIVLGVKRAQEFKKNSAQIITVAPETSTLIHYA